MNENIDTEVTLTPEEMAVIGRHLGLDPNGPGETTPEEAEVFITEDTADHVAN